MATAEELLAAEVGDLVAADVWFEVDLEDRVIRIPKGVTNLGVKSDADVKEVKFKLPRFYHDSDLYKFKIGIDYTNAEGEPDRYEPTDVKVDGEVLTFTWVVGRHAAIYNGNVTFNLCLKLTQGGEVVKEFHTTDAVLPILDTTETCEFAIVEYTDLLEQWREQLFGSVDSIQQQINDIETNVLQSIEEKGEQVLASLPTDYTETYTMASQALRTRANAIVATAEGDAIVANDASDDYLRGMRIYGKSTQVKTTGAQLIEQPYVDTTKTINGVTFTVNPDGSIMINGMNSATDDVSTYFTLRSGPLDPDTYTYSCEGLPGSCVTNIYYIGDVATNSTKTFTAVEGNNYGFLIRVKANSYVSATVYPMLNMGSTALVYEPYTGGTVAPNPEWPQEIVNSGDSGSITTEIYARNLMYVRDITAVGITATVQSDGSILYTGTATENAWHVYQETEFLRTGTYTLTMITSNKTAKGSLIQLTNANGVNTRSWQNTEDVQSLTFSAEKGGKIRWCIGVQLGEVVNTTVKLMLAPGSEVAEWVPYVEKQTISLSTSNGLPGIPVTSGGNYTDANGQQWICDEIDLARGIYIQRVKIQTFTGEESWLIGEQNVDEGYLGVFYTAINDALAGCTAICNRYLQGNSVGLIGKEGQFDTYYSQFRINIADYTSPDEWKEQLKEWAAWDNPLTLVYILETPIETPLTDSEIYNFSQLHGNYPNTTVLNDAGAWMEVDYNADLTIYVHELVHRAVDNIVTDARIQVAVDNWLNAHYTSAEGVSF